jgi:succinate dehydrogenase / fumarate reductase cytochrome b subunit
MDMHTGLRSSSGQKALLAGSGGVLCAWLALHVLGNLGAFSGAAAFDGYAAALHRLGPLLWFVRLGLFAAVLTHLGMALALVRRARRARGPRYAVRPTRASTWASRGMAASGLGLLGFIVFHLLHMTFGTLHPAFVPGGVYHNLTAGLGVPAIAGVYVAGATLLGVHLFHGLYALPRSLGLGAGASPSAGQRLAFALAAALVLGFALVPLAVLAGVLS